MAFKAVDGLATGVALTALVLVVCAVFGVARSACSEWLFLAGGIVAALSGVWVAAGYRQPPGLVAVMRGTAEVYPSARTGSSFLDRFASVANTWLVAGLVMVAASFLMLAA